MARHTPFSVFALEPPTLLHVDFRNVTSAKWRNNVDSSLVATDSGARVGDSEEAVTARYHGQLRVEPHKYTGPEGHYLVFEPLRDTLHRIIFETDGQRVTTMRSGRRPAVEYVEGCA